jgi:hypothetical protein
MTVRLSLPKDVERRLRAEVKAGRHASLEAAILERLSRDEDVDLLAATGMTAQSLRRDLDQAWSNRRGSVDGETFFRRIPKKSSNQPKQLSPSPRDP